VIEVSIGDRSLSTPLSHVHVTVHSLMAWNRQALYRFASTHIITEKDDLTAYTFESTISGSVDDYRLTKR
jgi:hypothetical protein